MKKSKLFSVILTVILMVTFVTLMSAPAFAAENDSAETVEQTAVETSNDSSVRVAKAVAAAITVAVVGAAGAIGMAMAISKSADSMARQPEMASKINSAMMLGLVFIETAIIYALIVAILVIFVL